MERARVVIAGAGFGGIAAASALRRAFGPERLEIVLVDRGTDFVMGLRKTRAILGLEALEDGVRPLRRIDGVAVVTGEITAVDAAKRAIEVDGRWIDGDALVVALGASRKAGAIPGLTEHGINAWDRADVARARMAIERMAEAAAGTSGGSNGGDPAGGEPDRRRLVIGVFGTPYACPPAPFELALLARDRLGQGVDVTVFGPMPIALPVAGPTECAKVDGLLDEAGIAFHPGRRAVGVEPGRVVFADGTDLPFDVLLAVPPHACPGVLLDAGLAQPGGWVRPDPRTLELGPDLYAIGDCTAIPLANGLALPKAGAMAEAQGETVAARIGARLLGETPSATFEGRGACFFEMGRGRASKVSGAFLSDPPDVTITAPDAATMAEKEAFERSRLEAWFGG